MPSEPPPGAWVLSTGLGTLVAPSPAPVAGATLQLIAVHSVFPAFPRALPRVCCVLVKMQKTLMLHAVSWSETWLLPGYLGVQEGRGHLLSHLIPLQEVGST